MKDIPHVTRYAWHSLQMQESSDGAYVLYTDYFKLFCEWQQLRMLQHAPCSETFTQGAQQYEND